MAIFFYLFASLTLLSSILVINSKNPVYAVLWLIFAFCNSAGLMILLGAEFLAMILIVIYVGAVSVLFLFIIMMLDTNTGEQIIVKFDKKSNIALASFLIVDLLLVILLSLNSDTYIGNKDFIISNNMTNIEAIGTHLYTDFFIPFQISGIILFVAMIASIVLTMRTRIHNPKRQKINMQLTRHKQNGLGITKVLSKQGVKNINYDS